MAEQEQGKSRRGLFVIFAIVGFGVLVGLTVFLLNTESSMTKRQRAAVYEATAAEHMRNISAGQQIYYQIFGQYATFDQLIDAGILLNEKFRGAEPIVDGYVYRLRVTPREGERAPTFEVNADPSGEWAKDPGGVYFYLSSEVVGLRQNSSRPANATDRPRE